MIRLSLFVCHQDWVILAVSSMMMLFTGLITFEGLWKLSLGFSRDMLLWWEASIIKLWINKIRSCCWAMRTSMKQSTSRTRRWEWKKQIRALWRQKILPGDNVQQKLRLSQEDWMNEWLWPLDVSGQTRTWTRIGFWIEIGIVAIFDKIPLDSLDRLYQEATLLRPERLLWSVAEGFRLDAACSGIQRCKSWSTFWFNVECGWMGIEHPETTWISSL